MILPAKMKEWDAYGDAIYDGHTPPSTKTPPNSPVSPQPPEKSCQVSQDAIKINNAIIKQKDDGSKGQGEHDVVKHFFSWSDEHIKKGLKGMRLSKPRSGRKPVAKDPQKSSSSQVEKIGRFKVTHT